MSLMDKKNQFLELEKEEQISDMKEFQTLIKNLNAEQTVLNNRLIKTIDLIEKERELYKSNEKIREEKNKELSEKTKEIRGTERASSREVRKGFEGSRKYQEISHGNDESIKSDSSSSRENRQTGLEGQSKTIYNSNGNNTRSNIDNSRSIPVNKPNKVRDLDMER